CLECRAKHLKCDEHQPKCTFCSERNLLCRYPSELKWVHSSRPILVRHRSRRPRVDENRMGLYRRIPSSACAEPFLGNEERRAWELVSSNIPAIDGPNNPYRQLSFTALTTPILLETVLCIATEHMLNFNMGDVSTAARHQQQLLRSISLRLEAIEENQNQDLIRASRATGYLDHEALLTAIILQGAIVVQTADGVLEPHIRCAAFLMEKLDYFHRLPQSELLRTAIQRFAMVDVMLAVSRQRRPFSPRDFVLHLPDTETWDLTEPSFHKMTGCPQPLMCLFVRIIHLACDVSECVEQRESTVLILNQAYALENDLRAWGSKYGVGLQPTPRQRDPLDILSECFYWTAHLLLARRVFHDSTYSPRVQHTARTCFELMDQLATGIGPDSSLPQPFYLAAREAITAEDRAWIRQKHDSMTDYYREQQRHLAMELTQRIWAIVDGNFGSGYNLESEAMIQSLDRQSDLFIF
ncbi:transcriptional regulator family: Fungal Specific TF, partial [Penicillium diatomitis]